MRRMYAGTRLSFHAPIQVGDTLRREIELTDLQVREGGTGMLIITTQTRRIFTPRGLALTEEGDTVFREAVQPGAKSGIPKRDEVPAGLPWRQTITPDPVSLFRFSAITFNPHRIHYDRPYATETEGYPGLVVHGPFTQLCLVNFVRRSNPGRTIRTFHMRARAPLFEGAPFDLVGRPTEGGNACEVWAVTPSGTIAMQATATLE
jgi:3-methylfumaryl-CoA hydratase